MDKEKVLTCKDCKTTFVFTEVSQKFFKEKGFADPIRCKSCREKKKAKRETNARNNIQ